MPHNRKSAAIKSAIVTRGTILFVGKGGEHRKLTGVYFISRLKANLVSLGQLDEAG